MSYAKGMNFHSACCCPMKLSIELTETERFTLQQLSLNHHYRETRMRGAGLLLLAKGLKPVEVSKELLVSFRAVYNWIQLWCRAGICGLLCQYNGGRPRALSPEMVATAVDAACSESLSLAGIAKRVEAEHGALPCTLETLASALKEQGLSYKRSRYSLKKNVMKPVTLQNQLYSQGSNCSPVKATNIV